MPCLACTEIMKRREHLPKICHDCYVLTGSREIERRVWQDMKTRCYNTKAKNYKYYGGRGIVVCDQWRNSFDTFYADMGPRPSSQHSIERMDNDGDYEPSNCIWATRSVQVSNRRLRC